MTCELHGIEVCGLCHDKSGALFDFACEREERQWLNEEAIWARKQLGKPEPPIPTEDES